MRQYSRVKNLIERDNNTRYFHILAFLNKKQTMTNTVTIEGKTHSRVTDMRNGIRNFFLQNFTQEDLLKIELPLGVL